MRHLGNFESSHSGSLGQESAAVAVFIFNPHDLHPWLTRSIDRMFQDVVNIQSIGAAIQNMLLAAQELGIGSLWICDVFFAHEELLNWLGEKSQMIAAVSLGNTDESPMPDGTTRSTR